MTTQQIIGVGILGAVAWFWLRGNKPDAAKTGNEPVSTNLDIGQIGSNLTLIEATPSINGKTYNVAPIGRPGLYVGEIVSVPVYRSNDVRYQWTETSTTGYWKYLGPVG